MVGRQLLALIGAFVVVTACSSFDEGDRIEAPPRDAGGNLDGERETSVAMDASPPRCDPRKPFGAPTPLVELSTQQTEGTLRLTPDELSVYFDRYEESPDDASIYMATRPSRTAPFSAPTKVAAVASSANDIHPSLSADGLSLYFARYSATTEWDIFVARRAAIPGELGEPTKLAVSSALYDAFPFASGDRLWFATVTVANGDVTIAEVAIDGTGERVAHPELSSPGSNSYNPVLSFDGKTIYFASARLGGPDPVAGHAREDIWVAHRDATNGPFGTPTLVSELATGYREMPGWLSPDDCRLYMSWSRLGSLDLYVAERTPQ